MGEFYRLERIRVLPKPAHPIPIGSAAAGEAAYKPGRSARRRVPGDRSLLRRKPSETVARIRRDKPEENPLQFRYVPGWDPQGMDPGLIHEESRATKQLVSSTLCRLPGATTSIAGCVRWICWPNCCAERSTGNRWSACAAGAANRSKHPRKFATRLFSAVRRRNSRCLARPE